MVYFDVHREHLHSLHFWLAVQQSQWNLMIKKNIFIFEWKIYSEEKVDCFRITISCCSMQGWQFSIIRRIDICSVLDKQLDDFLMP